MPTNNYFSFETIEITSVAFLSATVSAYFDYEVFNVENYLK